MTDELDGLRDAFDHAPCGYVVADPGGRIRAVNATMTSWLGRSRASLIGTPFADLLTAGGRIHYETHFGPMLLATGSLTGITIDLVGADDQRIPVLVTASIKLNHEGRPVLIRIIANDASDRRSYERELLAERRRAEDERTRAVSLAETLQYSLLPPSLSPPDGLDAAAMYHNPSAGDVGGDFYDLFQLSHDRYGFFLGDVCGKGVAAATLTSLTRYTLRAAAVSDEHPTGVLYTLDRVLKQDTYATRGWFCTVLFGVITRCTGGFDLEVASGGHPPPLLLAGDGTAGYVPTEGGQAVGLFTDPTFVSAQVSLRSGDTLVLYSDGITEARTGSGRERFDDDGALLRLAEAQSPCRAHDFVAAMHELVDGLGTGVEDDAAVLALGVP